MIDQLKLFRGEGFQINDKIVIRQPTLDEIVGYGEQNTSGLSEVFVLPRLIVRLKFGTSFTSFGKRWTNTIYSYPFFKH